MIKKIIALLILLFHVNNIQAAFYEYNIAGVTVQTFNDGQIVLTENSAGVLQESSLTYSGTTISSSYNYNIAGVSVTAFNNGTPVYTPNSAKVTTDLLDAEDKVNIKNDQYGNIAGVSVSAFNDGTLVYTPLSAKVEIMEYDEDEDGNEIENDYMTNIAGVSVETFNNGGVLITDPSAKVSYTYSSSGNILVGENDLYGNIAGVSVVAFNNGNPVYTDLSAIVSVKPDELTEKLDEYADSYYSNDGEVTRSNDEDGTSNRQIYVNSKDYVYMGRALDDVAYLNIYSISDGSIKDIGKNYNSTFVYGDNKYFQKVVKTDYDGDNLDFGSQVNLGTRYLGVDEYYLNQEVNVIDTVLPPTLTYPYYTTGTGYYEMEDPYLIKTNYPTIKGVGYPDSIMEATLQGKTYYIYVDSKGSFEFTPDKLENSESSVLTFQYKYINGTVPSEILSEAASYDLIIRGDDDYSQPYISNIYNDDDMYSDIIYIDGFANEGILNYKLTDTTGNIIKESSVIVGEDKRFEFIFTDTEKITIGDNYIIEVWNEGGDSERKAFTLEGNTSDKIGIINYKDYDTAISSKLKIIGYSKTNSINNDTIRGYACEIGSGSVIDECDEENKIFLGTTNADKNGLFIFENLTDLEDGKIYLINLYSTTNLTYNKNIVLKIDQSEDKLYKSTLYNLINGLEVPSDDIAFKGVTLSGATINVKDSDGNILETFTGDDYGYFDGEITVPSDGEIELEFSKGSETFTKNYTFYVNSDLSRNIVSDMYYFDYDDDYFEILEGK